MRQIRCRLYKGLNTKEPDVRLHFRAAQSKSAGQGPPAAPPAQRHEHSTVPEAPGTRPSRLGVRDPLTVHGAPQQLLHVPRHVHGILQVKVTFRFQDGIGAVGGRG